MPGSGTRAAPCPLCRAPSVPTPHQPGTCRCAQRCRCPRSEPHAKSVHCVGRRWDLPASLPVPPPPPPPRSVAARSLRQGEQSYCLLITPSRLSASTPQGKPVSRAPSGGPFAPRALPSPRSPLCCSQKPLCYPPRVGWPLPLHPLTTGCWPLPAAIHPQRPNTMTPGPPSVPDACFPSLDDRSNDQFIKSKPWPGRAGGGTPACG